MREQPFDDAFGMYPVALLLRERMLDLIAEHERRDDGGSCQCDLTGQANGGRVPGERVREGGLERRLVPLRPDAPGACLVLAADGHRKEHTEEKTLLGVGTVVKPAFVAAYGRARVALFG